MKEKYIAPKVLENLAIEIEREILAASSNAIDEDAEVTTAGQEVVEIDFSDFTSTWE